MALTEADIEQFIAALQADPHLRDRVRDVILAHDFLALPGIVERLGERMEQLAARIEELTVQIQQLGLRMDRTEGRLGNLEGDNYETKYVLNLGAHVARRIRKARRIYPSDLSQVVEAYTAGRLTDEGWNDLHDLDVLATGLPVKGESDNELYLAIELSLVVDRGDVERVARRAALLRSHGVAVEALVDGKAITPDAQQLADELGVTVLVRKVQPAA